MFVAIEVSGMNAGSEKFCNLGIPFALDFVDAQATAGDFQEDALWAAFQIAGFVHEAWDFIGGSGGWAIAEVEMDAYAEFGVVTRDFECRCEGPAVRK